MSGLGKYSLDKDIEHMKLTFYEKSIIPGLVSMDAKLGVNEHHNHASMD